MAQIPQLAVLAIGGNSLVPDNRLAFDKPRARALDSVSTAEAKRYVAEEHFDAGSTRPRVEVIIELLEAGGREAVITDPPHLPAAVRREAGTRVVT
jgi:carbamate kinase